MKQDLRRESWRQWISSNSRGWRIIAGFVCVVSLALFFHFREDRLDVLELNGIAGRHIVTQIDFAFPDYETTVFLRQQATQEIGKIYKIDDKQIRDARSHLEELIHGTQRNPMFSNTEKYKAADAFETLLFEARFTDLQTIQKIQEFSFPTSSYYEFFHEEDATPTLLTREFWQRLSGQISQEDFFHPETIQYILGQFQEIHWMLVEDIPLENALRARIGETIPEQMTKVLAGTRLIDQGEKVTTRHLAMLHAMKQAISENRRLSEPLSWMASFLISIIFVTISALYFRISQVDFIRSLRKVALFVCIVILTLLLAKLTEYILLRSASTILMEVRYPILAPFATLLICILLSPRTALFAATFLSIILSVSLAFDHSRFLVINLVTSIVMIICSQGLRRRKEVFTVCLKSACSAIPVLYAFTLGENHFWSTSFVSDTVASFAFLVITAILIIGILPALETIFGIMTEMSLVEYMDPNSELLREFAVAVPGTYQHSLVLGSLAEMCARAIGANGLFCRSATLYHDIGKMNNPQFYTENQQNQINMHQLLTPLESAQVIISHVSDGVAIAYKHRLPESFIEIIREHHGTTLVEFFYREELKLKGGDKEAVSQEDFRYPGPKPHSKESAIIMICDSIEAASRSIEDSSESAIKELIDRIITGKAEDGQFDESQLTFEEISQIKNALIKALPLMYHVRVKYPKIDRNCN